MRIFKFRHGSQKDFEALEQSYIWFSSLDKLNDPFEGCFYLNPEVSDEILGRQQEQTDKEIGEELPIPLHSVVVVFELDVLVLDV